MKVSYNSLTQTLGMYVATPDAGLQLPYIANCSRWKSFTDGQGTSNSLENFRGSLKKRSKKYAHMRT